MLGGPTIATSNPSRILSEILNPDISRFRSFMTSAKRSKTSGDTSTGTSSSAKSIVASISAAARINDLRQISTLFPIAPEKTRIACLRCASVSELMRSASPST